MKKNNQAGAGILEYCVLLSFIAVITFGSIKILGLETANSLCNTGVQLKEGHDIHQWKGHYEQSEDKCKKCRQWLGCFNA